MEMEQEKLKELVEQARQGEPAAQEALLAAVQNRVYYHCKKMLKHEQDAQDAAQDVLIAVLTGLDKLREPAAFWGWVNGITANRCRHLLSAPHKEWQIPEDEEGNSMLESVESLDQTLVPEAVLDDAETQRMILDLVDALPPEQRMSVLFYYYDEMSVKQIAQAMEVSEGTVKSRLNYARKSIRSGVEEYERKGVKLYSLSPLVLLVLFLRQEAESQLLSPQAAAALSGKVLAGAVTAKTAAGTATAESGAAGGAASAGSAAGAAAKVAAAVKAGLSAKAIAGIVAGALLLGGGALGIAAIVSRDSASDILQGKGPEHAVLYTDDTSTALVNTDGSLWAWGSQSLGALQEITPTPAKIRDGVLSLGVETLVTADHSLWLWDDTLLYSIDNVPEDEKRPLREEKVMDDVQEAYLLSTGYAVLKTDNSLWVMGDNDVGQLGTGTTGDVYPAACVMENVVCFSSVRSSASTCGAYDMFTAVTADGTLWMWGCNCWGLMGLEAPALVTEPLKVMDGVSEAYCREDGMLALRQDGSLWSWGDNTRGDLGNGSWGHGKRSDEPIQIMDKVVHISVGYAGQAAIRTDGTLWTWGGDATMLGIGDTDNRHRPIKIMDHAVDVSCSSSHMAALKDDGTVWVWGRNESGQLGVDPSQLSHALEPIQVNLEPVDVGTVPWDTSGYVDDPDFSGQSEEPDETYPEAYAAYAQVLEEHRELIDSYCKWYEEMGSSVSPVAFTDVYGDSTPEMIFVEADPALPLSQSHLTIVTFRDGQAVTILQEDWDFFAGSGLRYTLFQETNFQPLYAKTSYYNSKKVEEHYAFTEAEGALRMESAEYTPSSGQIVLSNQGKSGMGMTVDEAAAFLAENMTP